MSNNDPNNDVINLRLTRGDLKVLTSLLNMRVQTPFDDKAISDVRNYLNAKVGNSAHFNADLIARLRAEGLFPEDQ